MPRLRAGLTIAVSIYLDARQPAGSMPSLFMQDAATAFASMALVEADAAPRR